MKKITCLFLFSLLGSILTFATVLPFQKTSLKVHLETVNEEWKKYELPSNINASVTFENDKQRIRQHLNLVEAYLRKADNCDLSNSQIKNRQKVLDILKEYYQNECFPINLYHKKRQPYFIDDYGTACAVGHLMIETGFFDIAQQISDENNYSYISELNMVYAELGEWADVYGFTVDELALIQPAYGPAKKKWYPIGNGGGVDGQVNVMDAYSNKRLYLAGEFSSVDGVDANNIIEWDGENWSTLGNGVIGAIHALCVNYDGVYVGGDFEVVGNPNIKNFAYWNGSEWEAVTDDQIDGIVYTIYDTNFLYIGGDFTITSPTSTIENLAFKRDDEDFWVNDDGDFSVNGVVKNFHWHLDNLLVVGGFTETGIASNDPDNVTKLSVNGLAYWDSAYFDPIFDWVIGFSPDMEMINCAAVESGYLIVGAAGVELNEEPNLNGIGLYSAGLWNYIDIWAFNSIDPLILGFVRHDLTTFAYGNINYRGILPVAGLSGYENGTTTNGVVRAAESFQGYLYAAGDFSKMFDQPLNGLGYTAFEISTSVDEVLDDCTFNVYEAYSQINFEHENLLETLDVLIYDLNGQQVAQGKFAIGTRTNQIPLNNLPNGIYVYQAKTKDGCFKTGKISFMN